jgi:hypothetical protein
MKDMISVNYFNSKNEEKKIEEEIRNIRNQTKNAKSVSFFHEIIEKMSIKLSI